MSELKGLLLSCLFAFPICILMSCDPVKLEVHGHRGFKGLYPENTLLGFQKAAELGVDVLEMDVCVSKDKIVVVSHEPYLNPAICVDLDGNDLTLIEPDKINLYKMDYEEIQAYDCGSKVIPGFPDQLKIKAVKPRLDEVLESVSLEYPNLKFNIEIKAHPDLDYEFTPPPDEYARLVIDVLRRTNVLERSNLQSFDLRILEAVKIEEPNLVVALLVDEDEVIRDKLNAMSYIPEIISPYYKLLNQDIVSKLKQENFMVIPWTVNEESDMKALIELGIDGIITDYPDKLMSILY